MFLCVIKLCFCCSPVMAPDVIKLIKGVRKDIQDMHTAFEMEFRKEYREVKASLEFFSKTFEDVTNDTVAIEKDNAKNASLSSKCSPEKADARTLTKNKACTILMKWEPRS